MQIPPLCPSPLAGRPEGHRSFHCRTTNTTCSANPFPFVFTEYKKKLRETPLQEAASTSLAESCPEAYKWNSTPCIISKCQRSEKYYLELGRLIEEYLDDGFLKIGLAQFSLKVNPPSLRGPGRVCRKYPRQAACTHPAMLLPLPSSLDPDQGRNTCPRLS